MVDLPSIQKSFFRNLVAAFVAFVLLRKDHVPLRWQKGNLKFLIFSSPYILTHHSQKEQTQGGQKPAALCSFTIFTYESSFYTLLPLYLRKPQTDAVQDEVNEAYAALQNAIFGLREQPNNCKASLSANTASAAVNAASKAALDSGV